MFYGVPKARLNNDSYYDTNKLRIVNFANRDVVEILIPGTRVGFAQFIRIYVVTLLGHALGRRGNAEDTVGGDVYLKLDGLLIFDVDDWIFN